MRQRLDSLRSGMRQRQQRRAIDEAAQALTERQRIAERRAGSGSVGGASIESQRGRRIAAGAGTWWRRRVSAGLQIKGV